MTLLNAAELTQDGFMLARQDRRLSKLPLCYQVLQESSSTLCTGVITVVHAESVFIADRTRSHPQKMDQLLSRSTMTECCHSRPTSSGVQRQLRIKLRVQCLSRQVQNRSAIRFGSVGRGSTSWFSFSLLKRGASIVMHVHMKNARVRQMTLRARVKLKALSLRVP